jgi:hypothetical protein
MTLPTAARRVAANGLLLLASVVVGLLAAELGLRWLYPISIATVQSGLENDRAAHTELMVPDSSLGLRPNLGTAAYDANGVGIGSILSSAENPYKILFIGDSVTARGRLMRALAVVRASDTTSYLNGGVEAYNIQQEVEFFLRYQSNVGPQEIFHTLHVNDLVATRLAYRNRDGVLSFHSPKAKPQNINASLYRHSQLYRFLISRLHASLSQDELRRAAFESLRQLRDYAQRHGIAYHTVLFPVLKPLADWSDYDKASREYLLSMTRELQLGTVDLLPVAERLFDRGIDPKEGRGDIWHPNQIFADEAVRHILASIPSLAAAK